MPLACIALHVLCPYHMQLGTSMTSTHKATHPSPPLLLSLDIPRPMQNNLQRSFPDWSQRCQHHALRRAPDHRTLVLLDHEAGVLLALVFDLRNGGRQGDG